jgi:hypothetical protein
VVASCIHFVGRFEVKRSLAFVAAFSFGLLSLTAGAKSYQYKGPKPDKTAMDCYRKCGEPMQRCVSHCGKDASCVSHCSESLQTCTQKCPKVKPPDLRQQQS